MMASTPSASALSAVLRCRGNIFARNQANKRPPAVTAYSLGIKCVAASESGVTILDKEHGWEAGRTLQKWKSFFLGERVEIWNGVFLAITWEACRKNTTNKCTDSRTVVIDDEQRKVRHIDSLIDGTRSVAFSNASLLQSAQQCHQARLRKEPDSSQKRVFTSGIRKCIGIKNYEEKSRGGTVCPKMEKKLLDKLLDTAVSKVLCISISYLPKTNRAHEQGIEPVILCWNGWTTVKNRCLILTVLVSEILRMKFGIENGRLSIPSVPKPAVSELQKSNLVKLGAQKMGEDGKGEHTTDQKVEPWAGRPRTNGEHQPLGDTTKVGKLD
ncbi:hypothetical protein AAFF_G00249920 [Aldrovandia affinis]|uniref:Uncharacterized protein n=1 Tax=Aldrovandia affinis TaxID=143900 RepID=A0AAD7W2M6_9TELE|nr:hypothetical protein AAFF_G00249920 [Aldrovandia affinis]